MRMVGSGNLLDFSDIDKMYFSREMKGKLEKIQEKTGRGKFEAEYR